MSDRGSILISTANDIGEALVEKLGGEGYAPSVWDKEYNKLGIAEVDSAPALSVLEDSSETGTARGSILMSTANAIGAMLNKKYNTDRGFKPKEWASAGRKMKALETDTKSGSIVNIQGAKETPLLSLVGTISPTIAGVSVVSGMQAGKNFLDDTLSNLEQGSISGSNGNNENANNRVRSINAIPFPYDKIISSYTWTIPSGYKVAIRPYDKDGNFVQLPSWALAFITQLPTDLIGQGITQMKFVLAKTDNTAITPSDMANIGFQIEVGSSASAYEPYKTPTTYTADLGRTVYGGTADFINGAGNENYVKIDLGSLTWANNASYSNVFNGTLPSGFIADTTTDFICEVYEKANSTTVISIDMSIAIAFGRTVLYCHDNRFTSAEDFKQAVQGIYIVYKCSAKATVFSFDGQEINTSGDVENYYTSAGDTSIEYYAVPTPYTRGTASGAIANVQSARTDLPFTKVKANIAPNLTGVESVEVTKAGENLEDPTVYTADLGEPVYGGSVDLVSGEVKEYPYSDLGTRSIFRDPNRAGVFYCALPGRVSGSDVLGCNNYAVMNIAVSTAYDKYVSGVNSYGGGYIFFRDTSLAGLSDAELTEALTGTLVSFDNGNIVTRNIAPQVIVPSEGVNNLWNNAGGDTDVEYFTTE